MQEKEISHKPAGRPANQPSSRQKQAGASRYPMLFGLAYRYKTPSGSWAFRLCLGRILALALFVFAVLFVCKTAFIYAFFKYQQKYDNMTLKDALVYPLNRTERAVAHGDYDIKKAKEAFENGDARTGFDMLVKGVSRSRKNLDGKKMLAQIFMSWGKSDNALEVLESGVPYAYEDIFYMRMYTQLLIARMDDDKLIKVCNEILSRNPESPEVRVYLAMALATVYSMHGHYAESKEIITKYGLDKSTPGVLRLSKNEWEQGNREEAIDIIARNIANMRDLDPVYALLVNYYILMNDYAKARQYGSLRILEKPLEIGPRVDYLRTIAASGDKEAAAAELERLFETNKGDPRALTSIANYAADSANLALMRKIYDNSIQKDFNNTAQFCMLLLETFITCKQYQAAVEFSEDIIKEKPKWLEKNEEVFTCLRAVAYFATGNTNMANALVNDAIKRPTINPRTLVATARRFALLGEHAIAHKLYVSAVERDPKHQYALVRLIQFELDAGNSSDLDKYIFRLLNLRRPPRDMILNARQKLLGDRFIFTAEREKIINAIDAIIDMEKVSGNRILSDLPSDYDDEKTFSSF